MDTFVDLEKAFDRVPREVLWWALRSVGVDEWIVNVVRSMYCDTSASVKLQGCESSEFDVKVGVHQGSVLSPLCLSSCWRRCQRSSERVYLDRKSW